jgi:hypothetical protein
MTYIREIEHYGRTETRADIVAFTNDLAKALDGTPEAFEHDHAPYRGVVMLNYGLRLFITVGRSNTRFEIHTGADYERERWLSSYGAKRHDFPSITVDASRPLDRLVKDIQARVVEPGKIAIAAFNEEDSKWRQITRAVDQAADDLKAQFPAVRLDRDNQHTRKDGPKTSERFQLRTASGDYVNGSISGNGTISFERLTVGAADAFAILAKLA